MVHLIFFRQITAHLSLKIKKVKISWARTSFKWVPNGIPGVETRLPILFSEGVSKKRITIERFVELTSTNPAKMYGLYPQKGSIKIGADADLTIWDPNKIDKIKQSKVTPWLRLHTL